MSALRDKYVWYATHIDALVEDSRKLVEIDQDNLLYLLGAAPSLMLEWQNLEAIADYEVDKASKRLKEILIPAARAKLRDDIIAQGEKQPSEARLDIEVYRNKAVLECSRQVSDLQFIAQMFKNVRVALHMKKENMVSINARQCVELKSHRNE